MKNQLEDGRSEGESYQGGDEWKSRVSERKKGEKRGWSETLQRERSKLL